MIHSFCYRVELIRTQKFPQSWFLRKGKQVIELFAWLMKKRFRIEMLALQANSSLLILFTV